MSASAAPSLQIAQETTSDGSLRLTLAGHLGRDDVRSLLEAATLAWARPGRLILAMDQLKDLDSAGAASLLHLWRLSQAREVTLELTGVSDALRAQLTLFRVDQAQAQLKAAPPGILEGLGDTALDTADDFVTFAALASDTTAELMASVVDPRRVRWVELVHQMAFIGSRALGTVGLINFLVGLTLAFQSAHQLAQFGADIYVADLTAVAMMREMGPLMTAILVAGRSGSAIAAEIATMKVSEELDALAVMGIPFTRFLAIPRLLATVLMMPLLVIMADVLGMGGGLLVGVAYMDLATGPYLTETLSALGPKDLIMSLTKAVTFGWGIAIIALFNGMNVQGGAQEVGAATTSSVVQSLFFIIIMDAAFSILFYVVL